MLSRRKFLQGSLASVAALTLPGITKTSSPNLISMDNLDPLPEWLLNPAIVSSSSMFSPSQTTHQPVFRRMLADDRKVCPANLGYIFPYQRSFWAPLIRKLGRAPACTTVDVAQWDNAQGFQQSGKPIILTPKDLIRTDMVSTVANVPHQPNISWQTWRDYANQPNIDPNTQRLSILGDWAFANDQASIASPDQAPESPVDWLKWRQMEVANEIGMINDENPGEHIILELNPRQDKLYLFPDETIGDGSTLAQICPSATDLPTFSAELLTVFPVLDMRGPVVRGQMWAHIRHIDENVATHCINAHAYEFIDMLSLLAAVPLPVIREANTRVNRTSRIWPIQGLEFQPIGGGISQETLGNVALIIVGALVVIAIVALVIGQPQLILVAAVAL